MIDLRSDTVTQPTPEMLSAMMEAKVGDDVFGDDPTVIQLEKKAADLFNKDAAVFCPSGTMTNQIAINVHSRPMDEIICAETAHIHQYEAGGIAFNSRVTTKVLPSNAGRISADQIKNSINMIDIHKPVTSLVCVENTTNKGGGAFYDLDSLKSIAEVCKEEKLKLHLDGARIFNALTETGDAPAKIGQLFDSISICLSKGLGCPVGSLLIGDQDFILQARRIRKVLGGGMRQVGYLAAAGIYALDNHINRIKEDHAHAKLLGACLEKHTAIEKVYPIYTNIVLFEVKENPNLFLDRLKEKGILGVYMMSGNLCRFVTHLGISQKDVQEVISTLEA